MLILPLHRKPSAATWPWVTTLLVLLNVAVYALLQSRDDRIEAQAQMLYFEQGLDRIEEPLYREWRASGQAAALPFDFDAVMQVLRGPGRNEVLFTAVQFDRGFQRALADGGALAEARAAADPEHTWAIHRTLVEQTLARSTTWRYALRYDQIEVRRLLGSMFLHGSAGHLIGNMVFLMLLGLLVEGVLARSVYAGLYLLSGVGSALASVAWRYGEAGYGVGASGAIAGLMGAFCVLWGLRKVRFFYWFFVVFNYVRAPALVLLPLWLGWEVWQLLAVKDSPVAFDAHAGGLVSGAVLAVLLRLAGVVRTAWMDTDDASGVTDRAGELREGLRKSLGQMDWIGARRMAEALAQEDSASFESRVLIWHAWSTAPGVPEATHRAARAVLTATPWLPEQLDTRKRVWTDYLRISAGKPRLQGPEVLALGAGFLRHGDLGTGLALLGALRNTPSLATPACQLLLTLALELHERQPEAHAAVAATLQQGWPESVEAGKLRRLAALHATG